MRLSVLVPSCGRTTLMLTLGSVALQLRAGDELLVDVNDDGDWGHGARNRMMLKAGGDWLTFIDDDDVYLPGALDAVRAAVQPGRLHLFRILDRTDQVLWRDRSVYDGNVSTQMVVVPSYTRARWGNRYQGDLDFIQAAVRELGEPVWCEELIAKLRPG